MVDGKHTRKSSFKMTGFYETHISCRLLTCLSLLQVKLTAILGCNACGEYEQFRRELKLRYSSYDIAIPTIPGAAVSAIRHIRQGCEDHRLRRHQTHAPCSLLQRSLYRSVLAVHRNNQLHVTTCCD